MTSSWWQQIADTVLAEFSDLTDVSQFTRVILRLTLAALLGGLIGLERERKGKAAGVRTHMLVAMGSALFMLVALQSGMDRADLSRVLQGVIAGVGFLGAGTILKIGDEEKVKGLTTAAGIWLTAAVGVAAGMGREAMALLSALLALTILSLVPLILSLIEGPHSAEKKDDSEGKAPEGERP